jgi:hypothetical protein
MGVDIYLRSVHEPFMAKLKLNPDEAYRRARSIASDPDDLVALSNAIFDVLRESGAYFRNGYNDGDVMWAMGLSWRDVGAMLDEDGLLPVAKARELIDVIEAHPLTRERLIEHYFDLATDQKKHPVTGPIVALERQLANREPPLPSDFDNLAAFLTERYEQLLAILRRSVELAEPLQCSL